jgi:hypothetical protein
VTGRAVHAIRPLALERVSARSEQGPDITVEGAAMTFRGKQITPPGGICTDGFLIRQVLASDVELDYAAVMASKQSLRLWEGSTWPEDDFTLEANLEDLEKMEKRHDEGYAFGYTVMNLAETECFGCIYVMPPEARMYDDAVVTSTGTAEWSDIEATVFFWVSEPRVVEGMDRDVLEAIRPWFENDWAFGPYVIVVNELFDQQTALVAATDLELQFEISMPATEGTSRAYA